MSAIKHSKNPLTTSGIFQTLAVLSEKKYSDISQINQELPEFQRSSVNVYLFELANIGLVKILEQPQSRKKLYEFDVEQLMKHYCNWLIMHSKALEKDIRLNQIKKSKVISARLLAQFALCRRKKGMTLDELYQLYTATLYTQLKITPTNDKTKEIKDLESFLLLAMVSHGVLGIPTEFF